MMQIAPADIPDLMALAALRVKARQAAPPDPEWRQCRDDRAYFIETYCRIYDATAQAWIPFALWPAQAATLTTLDSAQRVIILKARQLGLSWLLLCTILHGMIFRPAFTALVFSKREEEAKYLLGPERLQGIYARLPEWIKATARPVREGTKTWALTNGSTATAFPANGGDGRTASLAFVDECDLLDATEQNALLTAVKPTVDGGGQLVLLSKVNKREPASPFKRIYSAARDGSNDFTPIFLPWTIRPSRDAAWYAAIKAEIETRTGATDELYENYPATDAEALAALALDKRLPAAWLLACYTPAPPLWPTDPPPPALAGLTIYAAPVVGQAYVIGADPAEGNPTSDASALTVLTVDTGAEVATLAGPVEPTAFAGALTALSRYYGRAGVLVERNNHGHAVLAGLGADVPVLRGTDGKPGWLTTAASKARLYDQAAATFAAGDAQIRSLATYTQLGTISGNTLSAPPGLADDRAMSVVLALAARARPAGTVAPATVTTLEGW